MQLKNITRNLIYFISKYQVPLIQPRLINNLQLICIRNEHPFQLRMDLYSNPIVYLHCEVSLCSRQILSNGAYIPMINSFSANIQNHHADCSFFNLSSQEIHKLGEEYPFIKELSFYYIPIARQLPQFTFQYTI